ncbi:MAG: alpha/beta hydrolase [Myxococcales bacterium]
MSSLQCVSLYSSAGHALVGAEPTGPVRLCFTQLAPQRGVSAPRRVLLIHGNPSHLDHWIHNVPALRRHAHVLAYDQPGLGRSDDFADSRHSLERSADIALALLDRVGWEEQVDVIGQSHGGMVALALAARAPERVRSVVLLGTGGTPAHLAYRVLALPGLERVLVSLANLLAPIRDLATAGLDAAAVRAAPGGLKERSLAWVLRAAMRTSFAPDPVSPSVVAESLGMPPHVLGTMARLAGDDPCRKVAEYASRVRVPVWFIHARADALVGLAYARRLFEIMRLAGGDVRFSEVEGGHMMHFTRPEIINPLLESVFASP